MKKKIYHRIPLMLLLFIIFVSFKPFQFKQKLTEKIYSQTDRSFYFPGETIWFKSYIVNEKNEVSTVSDVVYASLISPKGTTVKEIRLPVNQGYAYGDFTIGDEWVGGVYSLKVYTNWMRNFGTEAFFTKKITIQKIVKPNLLLKLKFKEESYGKSSTVKANFEVKDLKNNPLTGKRISYSVSFSGIRQITGDFKTDEKGKKELTFQLPDDLNTSDVILNIFIPNKGTTESISRSVPILLDKIDLQFFPESGSAIANTHNKIAFKALNEFGKPADVGGEILDNDGALITNFKSFHDGMGSFNFIPKSNKQYYAKITSPFLSDSLIKLPTIKTNGVKLSLKKTSNKETLFEIYSSIEEAILLKGVNASQTLYQKTMTLSKGINNVTINTEDFPIGISKFSIFNNHGNIICERLVFLNENSPLNIQVTLNKKSYKTREKVSLKIRTSDGDDNPITTNLSLSVTDNKLVSFADDKQDHILSSLLLSSELKGKIHKPVFYFDTTEVKAKKALDYVMLTHGWRNYIEKPILSTDNSMYLPENRGVQFGSVVDKKGKPISAHLLLFDINSNKVLKFNTNTKGHFSFRLDEGNNYVLIAHRDDKQKINIIKSQFKKGTVTSQLLQGKSKNKTNSNLIKTFNGVKKPLQKTIKKTAISSVSLEEDANSLDEVIVTGYGTAKKSLMTGAVTTIKTEELNSGTATSQLIQGKTAGVQINNISGSPGSGANIIIRGSSSLSGVNQPLLVVDGVPVNYNDKTTGLFNNIDPNNIASINILKGTRASSLYGSRGARGVVLIATKKGVQTYGAKVINNQKYNNYAVANFYSNRISNFYSARQFYTPIYNNKELSDERTDFRQTIYWNPVIQTDEKGEAILEFYNSDAITSFKVTAEGIGYNGLVGRKEIEYSTKKFLNVAFKAPNYLSLNDTIILPVTITNETAATLKTSLNLKLPAAIKLANINDKTTEFTIRPNSFEIRNIPVIPIKKTKNVEIIASVKTDNYSDVFRKNAEIISPYFPTEVSISGYKNNSFIIPVNSIVPNSLSAEFNIYTDIVGDVMNGIESLIRQPWGCFEQVSSATYPNVLILKYLKESGKSNPDIEKRALKFIKEGYKKLAAYETSKNGFEWYGRTPPHEALSAYGILEFTEMKEVYDGVNQEMIERTVKWLLSRKDGNGGFQQKSGKYGFSAAPKNVNNAYIVYAISESKINAEIEKEYNATIKEALNSNDSYRMALTALASFNLKNPENARILISKIKNNIEKHGFSELPTENTITRSYGNAKQIETAAFTILALLKEGNSEGLVTKGIEFLLENRKNGRFGSTQSTSMALKALIAYTKNQKVKILDANNAFTLTINDKNLSQKLAVNETGRITIPKLDKYIKEGLQEVTIAFTNPEVTFPYALDIKWDSYLPSSSEECKVVLKTTVLDDQFKVGDNLRLKIEIKNIENNGLPMATAIIGLPSGTTPQPWQLKELLEKEKVAYYEVFDNYLVFYWRELGPNEIKEISLDLKADIAGKYQAPASTVYLYYTDEHKFWIPGNIITIKN